jgi:tRNA dimethylallyltransferase
LENRVIIVTGPTASGKSDVSWHLAKRLDTEIISADSRQIYRQLPIGSAHPSPEQLQTVKHHLVASHDLTESFDAGAFETTALSVIQELHSHGQVPIVCGGSGLYIQALTQGIIDIPPDENIRLELQTFRREYGNEALYQRLMESDPEAARSMLPQNYKRVMRALEVYNTTGKSILHIHEEYNRSVNIQFQQFGLLWERPLLYERINRRVETMLDKGLIDEVDSILNAGFSPELNGLNTVGYKEIIAYKNGQYDLEEAKRLIQRNTRHYAKRQMTWFNARAEIRWIPVNETESPAEISEKIYREIVN